MKTPKTQNKPLNITFALKVHEEMKDWIAAQGGAEYIRRLIREDRKRKLGR